MNFQNTSTTSEDDEDSIPERIVVTFGTFDLFHIGHLNIIRRAAQFGEKLYVGVSTDKLNFEKKLRYPIINQEARKMIVSSIKGVTGVFDEDSLELKKEYIEAVCADVLVMGDDWKGKFDFLKDMCGCEVVYLPRTPSVSTTRLIEKVSIGNNKQNSNEREY